VIFELAQDFHDAVTAMPNGHPRHRMLELLEEAIRRDVHFIGRHPTTLFQCMWNTCWWYDCPEASRHYDSPEGPWSQSGLKLHALLAKWRQAKRRQISSFSWLRRLQPAGISLGGGMKAFLRGHTAEITALAVAPNNEYIGSCAKDGTIRIWDFDTGAERQCFGQSRFSHFTQVEFSPAGDVLLAVDHFGAHLFEFLTGRCLRSFIYGVYGALCGAFFPDGKKIAVGEIAGPQAVVIWSIDNDKNPLLTFGAESEAVCSIAISRDGSRAVGGCTDGMIRQWNAASGDLIHECHVGDGWIKPMVLSPEGDLIIWGRDDGVVCAWKADTGMLAWTSQGHSSPVLCIACSLDGASMVSGSGWATASHSLKENNPCVLRKIKNGDLETWLVGHQGAVTAVAFSKNGSWFVSGGDDDVIIVWKTAPAYNTLTQQLQAFTQVLTDNEFKTLGVRRIAIQNRTRIGQVLMRNYSPDATRVGIVLAESKNQISVRDAETLVELFTICGHAEPIVDLAFSPQGDRLISTSKDMTVRIWNASTGEQVCSLEGHKSVVEMITWSKDSRHVATAGGKHDREIRIWDTASGLEILLLRGHADEHRRKVNRETWGMNDGVRDLVFSANGEMLISRTALSIRGWNVETGEEVFCLHNENEDWFGWFAASPDGAMVAINGSVGGVYIFDTKTNRKLTFSWEEDLQSRPVRIESTSLQSSAGSYEMAFSPDGQHFVAQSSALMHVWELPNGRLIETHEGTGDILRVALGPDRCPQRQFNSGFMSMIQEANSGRAITWFPENLHSLPNFVGRWILRTSDERFVVFESCEEPV
jgi:WD40 repeat protein